jgi:pimeloyl-ACP methyl ester carboxylesterase
MDAMIANTLQVPGASLYYEVRGAGPVLLMINGGPSDADQFVPVAEALADRYTVVIYDTRGNSRSTIDAELHDQSIELEAEDAHTLLAAVTTEPAYVFGNSSGAMVGLELARRYPQQVRFLVAHEPPITELLPDAASHRTRAQDVYDTYVRDGVGAGMMKFMGNAGLQPPPPPDGVEPSPASQQSMARMGGNAEFFLAHRLRAIASYSPDLAALQAASTNIVVGLGAESRGGLLDLCAAALAEGLGTEVIEFPGGHGGFVSRPVTFADMLAGTFLSAATRRTPAGPAGGLPKRHRSLEH